MEKLKAKLKFKAGDTIFNEGAPSDCLYIVKEGQVGVFKKGKGNSKVPITIVGTNQFLGELSLISNEPHSSTAISLTKVELLRISKEEFDSQIKSTRSWVTALLRSIVTRLQKTNDVIRNNNLIDPDIENQINTLLENNESLKARLTKYQA